jgi:N-acetylglutamate synthase-like GNAT family acetyltransferase
MKNVYHDLAYGATIDLSPGGRFCLLNRIAVQKRGQGAGARLMAQVLADADAESVDLMLSVDPSPGTDYSRLRAWYERLGFRQYDEDDPDTLVRYHKPNAADIDAALAVWEDATTFAYGGTARAKPLLTAATLIAAGDKLKHLLEGLR